VNKDKNSLSLRELGFEGLGENVLKSSKDSIKDAKKIKKEAN
jgi:hypothetical protein